MRLIDTHCHLDCEPLDAALSEVLARASARGVIGIIAPAYDAASWLRIQSLAAAQPGLIHPALGLHPWAAAEPLDLDELASGLRECAAVAVGEVGLDSKIDAPAMSQQIPVLERQLELARDLDLPVILHCRGAFAEMAAILQRFDPPLRGVLHAFSRSHDLARQFLRLGLHLGIGGAVTRPQAVRVREAVAAVPLERLLLETDAPSIGLHGVQAVATEPRHVREVAAAIAELRRVDVAIVAEATTRNAAELFGLAI
ncbi:MAG: TatD family hydrolase [Candidatus Krumholzibacteria bacterium]|jgi:TatD DNase family protein|nr:TatD family hydrolase [Candidatus Krumholzibacteria bacterium]